MTNNELLLAIGGVKWSAALLSNLFKAINFIFELGQSVGNSARRIKNKNLC